MACPQQMTATGVVDPERPWGNTVTVTAEGGDFGGVGLMGMFITPPGAAAAVLWGRDGRQPVDRIVAWAPAAVTVRLPEQSPAGAQPPYELELTIPRATGPADVCRVLLERTGPRPPLPVPVPTAVALFEEPGYRGRSLVAVPNNSPLGAAGGPPLNAAGLGGILNPIAALGSAAIPGGGVAGGVLVSALLGPIATSGPGSVKFERADANNMVPRFWDLEYAGFPWRVSAEDIMSSLVVIGEPGTEVAFFNAPDGSDREGAFVVTVGDQRLVRCESLAGREPQGFPTEPPGAIEITRAPDFWKWTENVKQFENELSSMKFV